MFRATVTGLILLGACHTFSGCQHYRIAVEIAADGTGRRTVEFERNAAADADEARLMGLSEPGFEYIVETGGGGRPRHLYRRSQTVANLAGWPATGGLVLRGDAGGSVRLLSEVAVKRLSGANGDRIVYRETLRWEKLVESLTDYTAEAFGAWLRGLRPALPETTVAELKGVVAGALAGYLARHLADLGADPQRAAQDEEWLSEEFHNLVADRLRRAGLAPERVRGIIEELQSLDLMTGIDAVLPGLDQAFTTGFELRVTMPGAVTGGNADIIDGNVAVWKFDLMRTIGRPWTLTAESGS